MYYVHAIGAKASGKVGGSLVLLCSEKLVDYDRYCVSEGDKAAKLGTFVFTVWKSRVCLRTGKVSYDPATLLSPHFHADFGLLIWAT